MAISSSAMIYVGEKNILLKKGFFTLFPFTQTLKPTISVNSPFIKEFIKLSRISKHVELT